ncbi:MAG: outer membrane lipoprotein LolB [Burkholderiaceae bacterium]|nr:outer membrane lipoprotein LolB [Burkholderiaceae bacterium]
MAMVTGCASLKAPDEPALADLLTGRMSVQVAATDTSEAHSLSAAFELSGTTERGRLDLNTPIGSTVARARWEADLVVLDTPQGQTRHSTLADMTRAMVGEELPVPAMFDWLRGRPWPGAESTSSVAPEPAGFRQMGWTVDLSRFEEMRILARRESPPVVTVQVKLDKP